MTAQHRWSNYSIGRMRLQQQNCSRIVRHGSDVAVHPASAREPFDRFAMAARLEIILAKLAQLAAQRQPSTHGVAC